jgi:hypothetical protein
MRRVWHHLSSNKMARKKQKKKPKKRKMVSKDKIGCPTRMPKTDLKGNQSVTLILDENKTKSFRSNDFQY